MSADPFAWPEDNRIHTMRAAINAVRAYAQSHADGLTSLANDSISARHVLSLLPEETP